MLPKICPLENGQSPTERLKGFRVPIRVYEKTTAADEGVRQPLQRFSVPRVRVHADERIAIG